MDSLLLVCFMMTTTLNVILHTAVIITVAREFVSLRTGFPTPSWIDLPVKSSSAAAGVGPTCPS